jgi:hypothetical protein
MGLLDAVRALTAFAPPDVLPPCDFAELGDVLDAHGLAPVASYALESHRIGASAPDALRERLLPLYQGAVNDNVFRMVTLKGALRAVDVPAVLLGGAAYVDWLYPHLAFRPLGDLRLAVRGPDGARFAARLGEGGFSLLSKGPGGHTATFGDGRIEVTIQEGLVAGQPDDCGLFERTTPSRALGATVARPSAEDALVGTAAEVGLLGLFAPLLLYVDLRELLRLTDLDRPGSARLVHQLAERAGAARALYGALQLTARFFPEVARVAGRLLPELPPAQRVAVDAVVERAADPSRLKLPRGAEAAARAVVAPRV